MLTLDGAAITPIEADLPAAQRIVGELLSALSALAEPVANTRAKAAPQTLPLVYLDPAHAVAFHSNSARPR